MFPEKNFNDYSRWVGHPLKVALVIAGLAFLFFSMGAHAFAQDGVQVSVSTNTLSLQPGSELPLVVRVDIPPYPNHATSVSFSINASPQLVVDGQLQPIDAWFSLARTIRIAARSGAPQGDYLVTIYVITGTGSMAAVHALPIHVHVGPKSFITYFTSPNTTLAPTLSNVIFSQSSLEMVRDQKSSFTVSFLHHGSATDYIIRFTEQPIGIGTHIVNATHQFVGDGQVVTSTVEVTTSPTTRAETFPLYLEAYNQISGERMQLGTVLVNVRPVVNITADMPFQEYAVGKSQTLATFLTLTNTEFGDQDVVIQSTSNMVIPSVHTLNVPSKSSVSIPVQILGSDALGVRGETLYVMNSKFTKSVSLRVRTVEASATAPANADSNSSTPNGLSAGLVTGALSPWIGFVVIILGALLIFSHDFRNFIRTQLPKPVPPAKIDAKAEEKKSVSLIDAPKEK